MKMKNYKMLYIEADQKAKEAEKKVNSARPLRYAGKISEADYDALENEKQHFALVAFVAFEQWKHSEQSETIRS
jgi:hypothetical protein